MNGKSLTWILLVASVLTAGTVLLYPSLHRITPRDAYYQLASDYNADAVVDGECYQLRAYLGGKYMGHSAGFDIFYVSVKAKPFGNFWDRILAEPQSATGQRHDTIRIMVRRGKAFRADLMKNGTATKIW